MFADRLGFLYRWPDLKPSTVDSYSQVLGGIAFIEYRDICALMSDLTTAKTRVKRQREKGTTMVHKAAAAAAAAAAASAKNNANNNNNKISIQVHHHTHKNSI